MPIEYCIDHERRLVMARGYGVFTGEDVFGYQREVWSRPDVAGYDELVDMSQVESIAQPSADRIRELAKLSAGMDARSPASRFVIVAPAELAFGLGRMYEAYRNFDERSTKKVSVFRSLEGALAFLGVSDNVKGSRG
jgi:hypothetical protein